MRECRFAGLIGIGIDRVDGDAINRGDIDDFGGLAGLCRRLQMTQQSLNQKERAFDIEVHHLVPTFFWVRFKRGHPDRASIIDQNVEVVF